jgi:hypothetical protein
MRRDRQWSLQHFEPLWSGKIERCPYEPTDRICAVWQRTRLDIGQETRDPEEGRVKLEEWDVKDEDGRRRIVPTSKESNFWIFVV